MTGPGVVLSLLIAAGPALARETTPPAETQAPPLPTETKAPAPTPAPAVLAAPRPSEEPFEVAYYYKVRWGFQPEFERLYYKNHFPILMAQKKSGRIRDVHVYRPSFHGDGRADWTFLVVIKWAGWSELAVSEEEKVARQLFPDFHAYQKEEQRRFEIVEAHWDVPLKAVDPPR